MAAFLGVATVEPGSAVEALRRGPGGAPYPSSSASYGKYDQNSSIGSLHGRRQQARHRRRGFLRRP
nr:hypothetical protein Itr_chr05CG12090 [Ipomoea trifida]